MTPERVEDKVVELIHREPFMPFVLEMADGSEQMVPHARLAINGGGAVFLDRKEERFVDVEFKDVRAIRPLTLELSQ
jgi:hypothetical protein